MDVTNRKRAALLRADAILLEELLVGGVFLYCGPRPCGRLSPSSCCRLLNCQLMLSRASGLQTPAAWCIAASDARVVSHKLARSSIRHNVLCPVLVCMQRDQQACRARSILAGNSIVQASCRWVQWV
jgi:hypothetical protein